MAHWTTGMTREDRAAHGRKVVEARRLAAEARRLRNEAITRAIAADPALAPLRPDYLEAPRRRPRT